MKSDNLKLGDVIKVNSPIRLKDVHLYKGYVCGYSYDENENVVAYAVSINCECYTVLIDEVEKPQEHLDIELNMTETHIKISVDESGKGRLADEPSDSENL